MIKTNTFLEKINVLIHSFVFSIINSNSYLKNFLIGSNVFGGIFTIDPKSTFKRNFPSNNKFAFIQIGGNDGVSFDFLYSEVIKRDCMGLIVEPSPKYFKELQSNYEKFENIICVRKAIYKENTSVKLYEVNNSGLKKIPDWGKGVGSIKKEHLTLKNLSDGDIDEINVEGITFMDLIKNYPIFSHVNYLQIDTEGFDFEILKLIDFSNFSCDFIKYEIANLNSDEYKESEKLLIEQGYQIVGDKYDNFCFKDHLTYHLKYQRP